MLSRPHVKMSSYSPSCIFFISDSLDVIMTDVDSKAVASIPSSVHNLESIDSLSGGKSSVLLWCPLSKLVKIFRFHAGHIISEQIVLWKVNWEIFTIDYADGWSCNLMPVLKSSEGSNSDEYPVYACKWSSRL